MVFNKFPYDMKGCDCVNTLKITRYLKLLLQSLLHFVRVETCSTVDGWDKLDCLIDYLLHVISHMSEHQRIDNKYHYVCQFVDLNDTADVKSANSALFNTAKWRDVNVNSYLLEDVEEVVSSFKSIWRVTSRNSIYYGRTIDLTDVSAISKAIAAAAVQTLTQAKGKDPIRAEEVLELCKGNGALKDYDYISGNLWIMCKENAASKSGIAFISPFVINLRTGKVGKGAKFTVKIEDRARERKITNRERVREIDDLER